MGSSGLNTADLPDSASPSLVLTHPSEAEKIATRSRHFAEWGGAMTPEQYQVREQYLTTIPLARDGGMTHWVLTTTDDQGAATADGQGRPILASCETLMKRSLVATPGTAAAAGDDVEIREEISHGIATVYTFSEYRGRSYASRMLRELGKALGTWTLAPSAEISSGGVGVGGGGGGGSPAKPSISSALWSDIGKKFYGKLGWPAYPSIHIEIPASSSSSSSSSSGAVVTTPITYDNLDEFCALDEAALRRKLARTARSTGKTAFAFAPSQDLLRWHLYRDSFIASVVYPDRDPRASPNGEKSSSESPLRREHPGAAEAGEMKGCVAGAEGRRVWAVWVRNYGSPEGRKTPEKNNLYILRVGFEDEDGAVSRDELAQSFASVMRVAVGEAAKWHCGRGVHLWNPDELVADLLARAGLEHRIVDRETDSIPSLMWYGDEKAEDVVWVANEKYCWC